MLLFFSRYHVMVSETDSDSDEEISTNGNKENSQRASLV